MKRLILSTFISAFVLAMALTASAQTTFSNVQAMSGWTPCTACAKGGANADFVFQQGVTSPSMDGQALLEGIRGGTPFSHVLAYKSLGKTTSATTQFIQEAYLLFDKPQNANGFSIAGHQTLNGKNYRFSSQCSFNKGIWSVWNTKAGTWQATNLACTRPPANTWTHVVIQTERTSDNREHFLTISVDGKTSYVNQYVYPESLSGNSIGMHLEMDGNSTEAPYNGYWDKVSFTLPEGAPSPTAPVPTSSGVSISAPVANSTSGTAVQFVASAQAVNPIVAMRIYVDSVSKYLTSAATINTTLTLSKGGHSITIQAWDSKGNVYKSSRTVTVQ